MDPFPSIGGAMIFPGTTTPENYPVRGAAGKTVTFYLETGSAEAGSR